MTSLSSPYLPDELILSEIVIRVPVKTLVRFKSVCKKWHSSISSPQFGQLHHSRWASNPNYQTPCAFVISPKTLFMLNYGAYDLISNGSADTEPLVQMCGSNVFNEGVSLIGSCNGLVSLDYDLYSGSECRFYIYNPCTGQDYQVPGPLVDYAGCILIFGFGYVSSLDDYKLVIVGLRENRSLVIVYSLYSKKWRVACNFNRDDLPWILGYPGVLVGETLHWGGDCRTGNCVGFNLLEEAFKEVKLPFQVCSNDFSARVKVCAMDGCLCVWEVISTGTTVLWMLKEYGDWNSWTKLFKMDWPAPGFMNCRHFLGFTTSGKFLVITNDGKIILADPNQDPPTLVPMLEDLHGLGAVSYVKTLVSSLPYDGVSKHHK